MPRRTAPPQELSTGGRDLWASCLKRDDTLTESHNPMRHLLREACRLKDQLDALQRIVNTQGVLIDTEFGPKIHPALAELDRQRPLLSRLLSTLRFPDPGTSRRPQRRGGTRGTYRPRGGTVTSLDRARRAAGKGTP